MIRVFIALAGLVFFAALYVGEANAGNAYFDRPTISGTALDWCIAPNKGCGKTAADSFCQMQGFKKSLRFAKAPNLGFTKSIRTGRVCDMPGCDGFRYIACLSSERFRFEQPIVAGVALDWCLFLGRSCGKPAADYFCQSKGYRASDGFGRAPRLGYTRLMKTGQICRDPGCGGFRYIDCFK
ncbi:MAG: hypothetical protein L3V56_03275 [Candidatus Magnetoovum sp. WYHC-5]|nr:hypothetical protein [Candidatus Magnetoovum sp. WYHC-5]